MNEQRFEWVVDKARITASFIVDRRGACLGDSDTDVRGKRRARRAERGLRAGSDHLSEVDELKARIEYLETKIKIRDSIHDMYLDDARAFLLSIYDAVGISPTHAAFPPSTLPELIKKDRESLAHWIAKWKESERENLRLHEELYALGRRTYLVGKPRDP